MADMSAQSGVESVTIDAVIIRADGRREDLGTIAEYQRSGRPSAGRITMAAADDGTPDPGSVLGQYRLEVETDDGTAHWGQVFMTANDARAALPDAEDANPDAKVVRVVSLTESSTGKTAKWEAVN